MDYADLREQGIRHLERMAGDSWTDFNAHDPGITILELVAYALSDLVYRIGHSVPDLLATGGSNADASLFSPEVILHGNPVTLIDLRKLVVDVPGVRNAWIEPVTEPNLGLHYHPYRRELSLEADPPVSETVVPVGLFRVLVDAADPNASGAIRAGVAREIHANRPLCQDFTEIRVLDRQLVQVVANVEIAADVEPDEVLLGVLEKIADGLSPRVRFLDPHQVELDGTPIDQVLDGPLLSHGILDSRGLAASQRPTAVRTSDLVQAVMDVPGVRAITRIAVAVGGDFDPWSIELDANNIAQLDLENSVIALTRGGVTAGTVIKVVADEHLRRQQRTSGSPTRSSMSRLGALAARPLAGRDRSVGDYFSLQHHLPALYGVAEMGLPASADPVRRAQAQQLKAYLLFFDQILADMFAQLAHVGDLFSFQSSSKRTYFTDAIDDVSLGLDDVRVGEFAEHERRLAALASVRARSDQPTLENSPIRKERFLNHMLALFAEELSDAAILVGSQQDVGESRHIENQKAFLRRYPRVSGGRGTAADALLPLGGANESGLAERIRLKLGLRQDQGEHFTFVEHLLLRPLDGDEEQAVPVLTESDFRDPFSLQVSFVFAAVEGRMQADSFRRLVSDTVRQETPAHLIAHVRWLEPDEWASFSAAHESWWQHRRRTLAQRLDLDIDEGGVADGPP